MTKNWEKHKRTQIQEKDKEKKIRGRATTIKKY